MSDNRPLSSGDRNSVDATDVGDKLKCSSFDDCDNPKPRRLKPAVTAPKPKFMTSKSLDEDNVLKNLDDVLDKEEEGGNKEVKEPGTDDHVYDIPALVTNVEDCVAEDACVANPPPDHIGDEEKPVCENVLESPVHVDSRTNESRGSILEDISNTAASSVTDRNSVTYADPSARQVQYESVMMMRCHSVDLVYFCFICCVWFMW